MRARASNTDYLSQGSGRVCRRDRGRGESEVRCDCVARFVLGRGNLLFLRGGRRCRRFPRGVTVFSCPGVALFAAWWALVHRGAPVLAAAACAGVFLVGAVALVVLEGRVLEDVLILAGVLLSLAAAPGCLSPTSRLPAAAPLKRACLVLQPSRAAEGGAPRGRARGARSRRGAGRAGPRR